MWNLTPWKKGNENRDLAVPGQHDFAPLDSFRREFDQLWNGFWNDFATGLTPRNGGSAGAWGGELTDHANEYRFRAELPGFEPDEIDVRVSGHLLTVRAEHRDSSQESGNEGSHYRYGSYQQTFTLPHGVDDGRIEARYHSGVLEVCLPKTESARGKRVEVRSA